jgi:hypothetical protein
MERGPAVTFDEKYRRELIAQGPEVSIPPIE